MCKKITAEELYYQLIDLNLSESTGKITFNLAGISVDIDKTDTVGIILQAWLKQYMINNDIFFLEPSNTQVFPDFYLDETPPRPMLEVKAFNYDRTPAFDIANFDSYCSRVSRFPFILDADYLIFGYSMDDSGKISIKKIWLHKIWEIAGDSNRYPLKTQVKRDIIYNIRPNTSFKLDQHGPFACKEEFLNAIYLTLLKYKGRLSANRWKIILSRNYYRFYGYELLFEGEY